MPAHRVPYHLILNLPFIDASRLSMSSSSSDLLHFDFLELILIQVPSFIVSFIFSGILVQGSFIVLVHRTSRHLLHHRFLVDRRSFHRIFFFAVHIFLSSFVHIPFFCWIFCIFCIVLLSLSFVHLPASIVHYIYHRSQFYHRSSVDLHHLSLSFFFYRFSFASFLPVLLSLHLSLHASYMDRSFMEFVFCRSLHTDFVILVPFLSTSHRCMDICTLFFFFLIVTLDHYICTYLHHIVLLSYFLEFITQFCRSLVTVLSIYTFPSLVAFS